MSREMGDEVGGGSDGVDEDGGRDGVGVFGETRAAVTTAVVSAGVRCLSGCPYSTWVTLTALRYRPLSTPRSNLACDHLPGVQYRSTQHADNISFHGACDNVQVRLTSAPQRDGSIRDGVNGALATRHLSVAQFIDGKIHRAWSFYRSGFKVRKSWK